MENLFLEILKLSVLCSVGILCIFAVSPFFQKGHTVFWRYCLWVLLAVRLVLPFDFSLDGRAVVIPLPIPMQEKGMTVAVSSGDEKDRGLEIEESDSVENIAAKISVGKPESGITDGNEMGTDKGNGNRVKNDVTGNGGVGNTKAGDRGIREDKIESSKTGGDTIQNIPEIGMKPENLPNQNLQGIGAQATGEQNLWKKGAQMTEGQSLWEKGVKATAELRPKEGIRDRMFQWASVIWVAGVIMLLIWQVVCYIVFSHKVKRTKIFSCEKENLPVYTSSAVFVPMLMGIRKPQIILPNKEYTKEQLSFILKHEFIHYQRKDLWAKLLLALARTFHWFNPFVIWMERQAIQDMELLCDSRVVRHFSREEKKQYGEVLLNCATVEKNRIQVLCTSEFSRDVKSLKERFANIFSGEGKKQGILLVIFGVFLLLAISLFVVFGSSGKDAGNASQEPKKNSHEETLMTVTEAEGEEAEGEHRLAEMLSLLSGLTEEEAANAIYGAAFPRLVYTSEKRAVLYDYWGLLIYDIEKRRIEQLLDLKAADLNHMQGSQVTHVEVSADGSQILLYNEPDVQERFVYYIDDRRLEYSDLDFFTGNYYDGLYKSGEQNYAVTKTGKTVYLSADSLYDIDGELYHSEDMQGLSLIVSGSSWGESEIYPLFSDYYEKQGDEVVSQLRMSDFCRILGRQFLYRDEEGWEYYLEEDEEKERALWEIAGAMEPLLLTRYRGEERQVLEDLIYQEAWRECPVLFVDGRIIYKAARAADIVGIKDATLVSIAMDGSDRKIADTIMYRVFDGICEDNGWIYYSGWTNDAFPKPLCRISPDFSSEAQFVEEIPGYLCGVMDGYVYYLTGKDKKPGIWKRNLATGEEQIYDKWGFAAEDILFFWVRERQFAAGELRDEEIPGCHIMYSPGYDDAIYTYNLPFE